MKKLAFGALFVGLIVACGGNNNKPKIVDAPPSGGSDGGVGECNVLTQMGCASGEKCTWVIDQEMPTELGHVGCAPDGNVDVGGACMYGAPGTTGYDNCKQGAVCLGGEKSPGVCKTICDQNGGAPMCDATHSCQVYDGLLGPSGMEAAGVCDPLCNPLDDNDFDGSGTKFTKSGSACGSAGDTSQGCYGIWNGDGPTHFSCSRVVNPTLVNRSACVPSTGPTDPGCETSGGNPYLNGCAAGYIPLYAEPAGSSTVICEAYCHPADCSKGNCGSNDINSTGATAATNEHRCANADALGNFSTPSPDSCIYGWWIAAVNMMGSGALPASPFNDTTGICLARGSFMLDNADHTAASTTPFPECSTMVASGTGSNCYGAGSAGPADLSGCYAADFGCLSTTASGVTTAFKDELHKRIHINFRLPYHTSAHQ